VHALGVFCIDVLLFDSAYSCHSSMHSHFGVTHLYVHAHLLAYTRDIFVKTTRDNFCYNCDKKGLSHQLLAHTSSCVNGHTGSVSLTQW